MGRPKGSKNNRSTKIVYACEVCGNKFSRHPYDKTAKFCSNKCKFNSYRGKPILIDRFGINSPGWKGGKYIDYKGYVRIYSPTHPFNNKKYVLEHRLVMEQHIGRYMNPEEIIHHINEIRTDNRIDNLMLLPNKKAHMAIHKIYKFKH